MARLLGVVVENNLVLAAEQGDAAAVCLKSTGLTQNIGIIGIFSQTAGSNCECRVNPVNFTLGTRRYYSCTATLANVDMSATTDAYWSRSTFRKHRATNIFSNAMSTGVAAAGGGRQPERHGLGRARPHRRVLLIVILVFVTHVHTAKFNTPCLQTSSL